MSDARIRCEACGVEYSIGDFPFCKGGHGRWNVNIIDDQLAGGPRWCETMGHEPVWLDGTKSQWKRLMDAHGVENVVRHDDAYYAKQRKQHDEQLRDTVKDREHPGFGARRKH